MARLHWLISMCRAMKQPLYEHGIISSSQQPVIIPVLWMKTPRSRKIGLWIWEARSHALCWKQKGPPDKPSILKDMSTFHVYLFKRKVKRRPLMSPKKMQRNTFKVELYRSGFLNGDRICLLLMCNEWPQRQRLEGTHSYYITAPWERKPGGFAQKIEGSKSKTFQMGYNVI